MLDIKWIISNPDQADKLFAKRGIKPMTKKVIVKEYFLVKLYFFVLGGVIHLSGFNLYAF